MSNSILENRIRQQRGGKRFPNCTRETKHPEGRISKACRDGDHGHCFMVDCKHPYHLEHEGIKP